MARTVLLGKPDQLKIDTMKKTIEALETGISAIKPGNTVDDVAQAFWKILDKYGIEKNLELDIQLELATHLIGENILLIYIKET